MLHNLIFELRKTHIPDPGNAGVGTKTLEGSSL